MDGTCTLVISGLMLGLGLVLLGQILPAVRRPARSRTLREAQDIEV